MPIFSAAALLAEIEPLPSGARFGTAIRHAMALSPAAREGLLSELAGAHAGPGESSSTYGRELAAAIAAATGHGAHIAAALGDPSPRVRSRVLRAALARPGLVDPAVLVEVVTEGPRDFRLALYRGLRPLGGTSVRADELIGPVRHRWGDHEAARLLPACDTTTVRALLPELAYAVSNWSAIGHRHPAAVGEYVAAELAAATDAARPGWWAGNAGAVAALTRYAPGELLGLCERWLAGPLPGGVLAHLGELLAHDTGRTVRLLLADPARARQVADRWLSRRAIARLVALPDAELAALLRVAGGSGVVVTGGTARGPGMAWTALRGRGGPGRFHAQVLGGAAPSRREALFDAANAGRDLAAEQIADAVLMVLPHARRHAEVRRMLALPEVRNDPARAVRLSAFLPYPEAVAALVPATRGADAEERAAAYSSLVQAAGRSRSRAFVADVLSHLGRVRNEQDPVRARVLWALAEVHPDLFDPADPAVPAGLDRLVRDAIDARDRSHVTLTSVQKLVFNVLTAAASEPTSGSLLTWALGAVERMTLWTYAATAASGWRELRRGSEHEVFARIRPWLVAAVERGQPAAVFGVARALGRRAWHIPELQNLLRAATRFSDDSTIRHAVSLWLEPPATRADRAAELVAYDRSYVRLEPVLRTVAYRRPDLVDSLLLAGRPVRGRFGTDGARWIPEVEARTVAGWTPARVRRYAGLLRAGVDDTDLQVWSRAWLARLLATFAGPAAVADLIAAPGGAAVEVPIVEGALAGLGGYEAPLEALPVLLDSADGDRARVAIFAAGRCVRRIRPRDLTAVLAAAFRARKITVRKEAARLLAVARPPGAVDTLLAAWRDPGLHRDVRIAVAAALREWPDDPRVWEAFEEASERDLALSLVAVAPQSIPVAHRHRFAAVVRRLAHHPDRLVVRSAHAALPHWLPYDPGCADDLARAVTDPAPATEWQNAVGSLARPAVWGSVPGLLSRVTTELVRMSTADDDAEPTSDMPARQRLRHLVGLLLTDALRRHPAEARQAIDVLRADPSFTPEAARLAAGLAWPGPGLADDLLTVADLLAGLPATTVAVVPEIPFHRWPGLDPASLARAASVLAGRPDTPAGLLAVALVAEVGGRSGWPAQWRGYLRTLRRHPRADVRHAALRPVTYPA